MEHENITLQAEHMREISSLKIASSEALNSAKSESESRMSELRFRLEAANSELRSELNDLQARHAGTLQPHVFVCLICLRLMYLCSHFKSKVRAGI